MSASSGTSNDLESSKVYSLAFGRVLLQQMSSETVYQHLHHPAGKINFTLPGGGGGGGWINPSPGNFP